jgi:hypothetical protein
MSLYTQGSNKNLALISFHSILISKAKDMKRDALWTFKASFFKNLKIVFLSLVLTIFIKGKSP